MVHQYPDPTDFSTCLPGRSGTTETAQIQHILTDFKIGIRRRVYRIRPAASRRRVQDCEHRFA